MTVRTCGCNCGAVRLEMRGDLIRVGLCHRTVCRKKTGGPYLAFAVFAEAVVTVTGDTRGWAGLRPPSLLPDPRLVALQRRGQRRAQGPPRVPRRRADGSGAHVRELDRPSREVASRRCRGRAERAGSECAKLNRRERSRPLGHELING